MRKISLPSTPGIRPPDGPARRGSLYRLSYPGTYSPYSNVILFTLSLKIDDIVPPLQARIICPDDVTSHKGDDVARRPSHLPPPINSQHLYFKRRVYYHALRHYDQTAEQGRPTTDRNSRTSSHFCRWRPVVSAVDLALAVSAILLAAGDCGLADSAVARKRLRT